MNQEIKIEKLAYGGEGIGYVDGKVCFVEGALPGEKVLAEIVQNKKKFARAKTVQVLTASPHRENPPCPVVEQCGGCQYQHLSYEEELRWKEIQVREYLQRNLKTDPARVKSIVGSPSPYGYRSSVTLHRHKNKTGFVGRDNETVIDIPNCLLAHSALAPAFQNPALFEPHEKSKTFRLSENGRVISSGEDIFFEIAAGGGKIQTHSKSFFQNNLFITEAVGRKVESWVRDAKPEIFLDLFSGAGTFTLLAAGNAPRILCAEENPYGVAALKKNVETKKLNAEILQGRVEEVFPAWVKAHPLPETFAFLDPPRMGMPSKLAEFLAAQEKITSLVYLSCHLGTLTRDLGIILQSGKFKIAEAIPFDMFPRTKHIEVLVLLQPA